MATKTVAWNSGSGVITLTYTGQGNGSVSVKSDVNDSFDERSQNLNIVTTEGSPEKAVSVLVKQAGKPLGWTTKDFGYTGSVQEVTLPKGRYKLQCWGAQGGNTSSYSGVGSKGGYSEGIITLAKTTTLYIFVGGKGASSGNGGWNGGGGSSGYSSYTSGNTTGKSYPACGGGATDISLVTSTMNYSSKRTNRSSESLLSRIIVAGGGAGSSERYTEIVNEIAEYIPVDVTGWQNGSFDAVGAIIPSNIRLVTDMIEIDTNSTYSIQFDSSKYKVTGLFYDSNRNFVKSGSSFYESGSEIKIDTPFMRFYVCRVNTSELIYPTDATELNLQFKKKETTTSSSTSYDYTNGGGEGGGTTGRGRYGGTQSSAGNGGAFGLGANMDITNYMYCGGAGGGGWYGGGTYRADGTTGAIGYGSGGSGFVNTAANASYRPSGYTGLQLDSGSTTAGNSSHPSVSGLTEVGHSGNGYARITVL